MPAEYSMVTKIGMSHHCGPTEERLVDNNSPLDARAAINVNTNRNAVVARKKRFCSVTSE